MSLNRALSPRVILLDIENGPNVVYTWGKYEQNAIKKIRGWELLCFAYKELGRGKVKCVARPDFNDKSDKSLVRAAWGILDGADVVITQNGDRHDLPKLRAKFVEHGLPPPTPFKSIDTKKIFKSQFSFYSNSLNDVSQELSLGEKLDTGGFELWEGCMAGDPKSWAKMKRYNCHDVVLLEAAYERVKAWAPSHPNLALYEDRPGCPVCSSLKIQRRGFHVMKLRRSARFQCQSCSTWFSRPFGFAEGAA